MTDQRVEKKIDFFSLPVAEEEKIETEVRSQTVKWQDPDLYANIISGADPAKTHASYSAIYIVEVKDLAEFPPEATHAAQGELVRRVTKGVEEMQKYILAQGLVDCSPMIYSRPDYKNIGMLSYNVGIGPGNGHRSNSDNIHRAVQEWLDDPSAPGMAQCTPGRNPITGHGEG